MKYSTEEVSDMLGLPRQNVNYWAKKTGVKRKGKRGIYAFTPEDVEVIKIKTKRQKAA
jgi:DNA-binding transcriptional MerR regulator